MDVWADCGLHARFKLVWPRSDDSVLQSIFFGLLQSLTVNIAFDIYILVQVENTSHFRTRLPFNGASFSISKVAMTSQSSQNEADPHSEKSSLAPAATREDTQNVFEDVPDRGFQAWLQVAAAFFIFMNTAGVFSSYGVLSRLPRSRTLAKGLRVERFLDRIFTGMPHATRFYSLWSTLRLGVPAFPRERRHVCHLFLE